MLQQRNNPKGKSCKTRSVQWILLDGPVDAVWIENLNTVLDDNKKLCLNSGEIIKLTPVTTMMFEVEDLSAASPATVSRCGMVFLEQQDIGWRVLLSSWCERLPDRLKDQAALLQELMDSCLDAVFEMVSRKVSKPVPVSVNWLVLNLLHLLWALLQAELPLDPSTKDVAVKEKEAKVEAVPVSLGDGAQALHDLESLPRGSLRALQSKSLPGV
ncbi:Dnah1 [Symbiodinium sp. CCMP2456]|nr:Dnah1 [Symbiodinium sp. CCMP2456]